jgi:hypothetical protein
VRRSLLVLLCAGVLSAGSASSGLPPIQANAGNQSVNCESDGIEGKRIEVVYLYPAGTRNKERDRIPVLYRALNKLDRVWNSAADPFDQHPRWLCRPNGPRPIITTVQGPPIGSDGVYTFAEVVRALKRAGYASTSRVYLIFADHVHSAFAPGGQATTDDDDRPSSSNLNNIGPAYAMVDAGDTRWNWSRMWAGALHELGHALGAVQCTAPHSTCRPGELGHHHCWDEHDVMCYDDGGSYYKGRDQVADSPDDRTVSVRCGEGSTAADQWDCGKDDYFNIAPVSGSYLATHWNLAMSGFVTRPRPE